MTDVDLIEAAIVVCAMMQIDVSTRHVQSMTAHLREAAGLPKRAVWGETVRKYLAEHRDTLAIRQRHATDTAVVLKSWLSDTPTIRGRAPRVSKGSLTPSSTNGKISNTLLPTVGEARTPWAKECERRTVALASRQLRTLDHKQMHDVACLFVIRFMAEKYKADDKITRKAIGVAGQIRNVVSADDRPQMRDLTVREFFTYGRDVFSASGGFWERPWDVVTWSVIPEQVPT